MRWVRIQHGSVQVGRRDCTRANELVLQSYPNCSIAALSYPTDLGDGFCDGSGANTADCGYDGGDCIEFNEKYPGCRVEFPSWVGDGYCDGEDYNTADCGYDCIEFSEKYPGCRVKFPRWIGDGYCDGEEYNKIECDNDGGDCL